MKLPPSFGPVWNLRLLRRVTLLFFVLAVFMLVACLVVGNIRQACAPAVSAIIFGFAYQRIRELTLRLEKWVERPGYRSVLPGHRLSAEGESGDACE